LRLAEAGWTLQEPVRQEGGGEEKEQAELEELIPVQMPWMWLVERQRRPVEGDDPEQTALLVNQQNLERALLTDTMVAYQRYVSNLGSGIAETGAGHVAASWPSSRVEINAILLANNDQSQHWLKQRALQFVAGARRAGRVGRRATGSALSSLFSRKGLAGLGLAGTLAAGISAYKNRSKIVEGLQKLVGSKESALDAATQANASVAAMITRLQSDKTCDRETVIRELKSLQQQLGAAVAEASKEDNDEAANDIIAGKETPPNSPADANIIDDVLTAGSRAPS